MTPHLKSVKADVPKEVLALWTLPRLKAEEIYLDAFAKNDQEALRWLCLNDRYFLLTCILRRPDARDDWIYARCREVEADPDERLDLWARYHYKSSIITFAGAIQEIMKDPEIRIGIFSHDRPAAKDFLEQIKIEIEENPLLHALFPEIFWADPRKESKQWSLDGGLLLKRKGNPRESTVEAWGVVEGMPTGKHYSLRIYDSWEPPAAHPDLRLKTLDAVDF